MTTTVLTALGNRHEARLASLLEPSREVQLVRRCPDLADLQACAEAGLAQVAIVSSEVRGLDLSAVDRLQGHGVRVIGVVDDTEAAERWLRQLGVQHVIPGQAQLPEIEDVIQRAIGEQPVSVTAVPGSHSAPPPVAVGDPGGEQEDARANSMGGESFGERLEDQESCDEVVPGRIVVVWGPAGAPGRTTTAVGLATVLAQAGVRTLLVDADTYAASIAQTLGLLDEAPGLAAACRQADQGVLDVEHLRRIAHDVVPGLSILTGLPRADRWPEVREAALNRVLEVARRLFAVIVIDVGFCLEDDEELSYDTLAPRRNAASLTVLSALADEDVVVAVGGADPVGLGRLVRGLEELRPLVCHSGLVPHVVVNRVRAEAAGSRPQVRIADALERFAGTAVAAYLPDDPKSCDSALLAGRGVVEHAPQSELTRALGDLAVLLQLAETVGGRADRRRRHT